MKLAIVGGGGFRTPLIYRALLDRVGDGAGALIDEVALYDVDEQRLAVIAAVIEQLAVGRPAAPSVTTTVQLDEAIDGADFVFTAVRVGGLDGRVADERVALDLGVLGQETTGPGGVAFGLRTVPVMVGIAERIARRAPGAFVINFTNPAGMITEAMRAKLGDRVVGICDSPAGLVRRVRHAVELPTWSTQPVDYAGLNHLGWLQSACDDDGIDRLPELLARPQLVTTFEEGQLFGAEWLNSIGAVPNEYLYYFYFTREAIASTTERTRGEYLLEQQSTFYDRVDLGCAADEWNRVRLARNASYMASARHDPRDADDVEHGGYEDVAVDVMYAVGAGQPVELILNVANRGSIAGVDPDAVVEVPCRVDATGVTSLLEQRSLPGHGIGLVQQIKQVEQLTIAAALDGSATSAVAAFALHPLVDSVVVARQLLAEYRRRIPALAVVFD